MWGRDTFIKSITGQVQTGTGVRAWDQDSAVISAREVLCLNMLAQLELLDGDEAQKQGSQVTLASSEPDRSFHGPEEKQKCKVMNGNEEEKLLRFGLEEIAGSGGSVHARVTGTKVSVGTAIRNWSLWDVKGPPLCFKGG